MEVERQRETIKLDSNILSSREEQPAQSVWRALCDSAFDATCVIKVLCDNDGPLADIIIEELNPAAAELLAAGRADLCRQKLSAFWPAPQVAQLGAACATLTVDKPWREDEIRWRQGGQAVRVRQRLAANGDHIILTWRVISQSEKPAGSGRAREQSLFEICELSPVAVSFIRDGALLYANSAALQLFGYESLIGGARVSEFIAPLPRMRRPDYRARHLQPRAWAVDTRGLRRDGTDFPVHIKARRVHLPDGPAWLAFLLDRTESEVRAQARREGEQRLRAMFDLAPIPVSLAQNGEMLYANKKGAELYASATPPTLAGHTLVSGTSISLKAQVPDLSAELQAGDAGPNIYETVGLTTDGTEFPILLKVGPISLADGPAYAAFGLDVTGFRQTEDLQTQLRDNALKAAQQWRGTFDAMPLPIFITDGESRITRLNNAARELHGKSFEELIGQTFGSLSRHSFWHQLQELTQQVYQEEGRMTRQLSDVDSARTWDVRLGYLPDSWATTGGGTGGRVITVLDDVTEKLELQESVRRGEMMSALGALVAGVAHEVRNPLFGMSAVLDAIDVTFGADSAYQPFTDALRTELTRLNGLMGDLLDYGRPPNTEMVRHSLTQTVMQGVVACAPLAERRRITINTKLSRAVEPVLMDAPRLAQVFQNLLENAIQHSSEKGHITVAVNSFTMGQEVWAECTVRDQGPGIAEDDLSNIFKPFYTRRRGGTGLGLSIVQRIVTEHRGTVTAANHPQGGAVMTVRLPCTN